MRRLDCSRYHVLLNSLPNQFKLVTAFQIIQISLRRPPSNRFLNLYAIYTFFNFGSVDHAFLN